MFIAKKLWRCLSGNLDMTEEDILLLIIQQLLSWAYYLDS